MTKPGEGNFEKQQKLRLEFLNGVNPLRLETYQGEASIVPSSYTTPGHPTIYLNQF